MFTTQIPLTFDEVELINKILIGCTKIVYRYRGTEDQWHKLVKKTIKPSKERLLQLYLYQRRRSLETVFSPKEIEYKFKEQVERVDHATVSRSLRKLVKVKVYEPTNKNGVRGGPGKRGRNNDSIGPGPLSLYTANKHENSVRQFVLRLVPRGIIYGHLYESDVLMQYLKFIHYSFMIRCKTSNFNDIIRSWKASSVIETKLIEEAKLRYQQNQNFVRHKSNKEILHLATKLAQKELIERNWETDELYTDFFVEGERCYPVIEATNL